MKLHVPQFNMQVIYPRGEKYSREVIFAFSRIAKIAKFCAS